MTTVNETMNKIVIAMKYGFSWRTRDLDMLLVMDDLFDHKNPTPEVIVLDTAIINSVTTYISCVAMPHIDADKLLLDQRKRHMQEVLDQFNEMPEDFRDTSPSLLPLLSNMKFDVLS
jgi:hypothetical protein